MLFSWGAVVVVIVVSVLAFNSDHTSSNTVEFNSAILAIIEAASSLIPGRAVNNHA